MPSERKFRAYFTAKKAQWKPDANFEAMHVGRTVPQYLATTISHRSLALDFQQDRAFAEHEICAFVRKAGDAAATSILMDVLGDVTGDPYLGPATSLVLQAIKAVCNIRT